MGRSPPHIPQLLEECHDLIDYIEEGAGGILSAFYQITTLLGMLIKGYQFNSFIFINQHRSVASTTGPSSGAGDIFRYITDFSVPASKDIGP